MLSKTFILQHYLILFFIDLMTAVLEKTLTTVRHPCTGYYLQKGRGNWMKNFLLPANYALVLLAIFQIYSIGKNWGNDDSTVVVSFFILIGCVLLLSVMRFFNKETNNR